MEITETYASFSFGFQIFGFVSRTVEKCKIVQVERVVAYFKEMPKAFITSDRTHSYIKQHNAPSVLYNEPNNVMSSSSLTIPNRSDMPEELSISKSYMSIFTTGPKIDSSAQTDDSFLQNKQASSSLLCWNSGKDREKLEDKSVSIHSQDLSIPSSLDKPIFNQEAGRSESSALSSKAKSQIMAYKASKGKALPEAEFNYIKDTWGNVEKRLKLDGTRVFVRLFQKHPEYKAWFPDFEHLSDEELKYNNRLRAHVLRVTTSLGILIYSLGDDKSVAIAARAIENTHHFRGVRRPHFRNFVEILKEYLHYVVRTEEARSAWAKGLDILISNMSYEDDQLQLF